MNDADGVLLSVRAEARQLVAPDYAVLDGLFEHTAGSKVEAVGSVAASLDRLTADLDALGGVPFDEATGRRPLTWSAYSSATRERATTISKPGGWSGPAGDRHGGVQDTVRDLGALGDLGGVLAAHPGLNVHGVTWHVDRDNPAWPQVRAAAIGAAIGKARDYAAALGATLRQVEHIADAGLLGGDTAPDWRGRKSVGFAGSAGSGRPETPALNPVPQELTATIEARFRTTEVSLPSA